MNRGCIIFLSILLFSAGSQGQELDRLLRSGDECFSRQATEEALRYYNQAYTLSPKNNEAILRLVRTYCDLGWLHLRTDTSAQSYYLRAAAFADTLLSLNPNSPSAHFWMSLTQGSLIPFPFCFGENSIGERSPFPCRKSDRARFHVRSRVRCSGSF